MGNQPVKTDAANSLNLVQLKANELPNVAIDSVWLLSAVHRPYENEKLVVRLHNYAYQKLDKIPLKLTINTLQNDVELKIFGNYTKSERIEEIYGIDVSNIDDALEFLMYHEGFHSVYILALKHAV